MRRAALIAGVAAALMAPAAARRPAPAAGTLTLDLADPVVSVMVAGVPLRLRVALDGRGVATLNTAAAARLPLVFEAAPAASIGRIAVAGRAAPAVMGIAGREVPVAVWTYGDCCDGVDGAIDARLLPFAEVRLLRAGATGGTERSVALVASDDYGAAARQVVAGRTIQLQFALDRAETLATAAAGAMLARAWNGRFVGAYAPVTVAWGVRRPARLIAFARGGDLAGFRFTGLRTRTADFAGAERLPTDPPGPNELVVSRRTSHQHGWPVVMIGRDRLDRCAEIRLAPQTLVLTARCTFDA